MESGYSILEGYISNPDATPDGLIRETSPDYVPVDSDEQTHWNGTEASLVRLEDIGMARLYRPSDASPDPDDEEELIDYYCALTGAENGERERVEQWLQNWEGL